LTEKPEEEENLFVFNDTIEGPKPLAFSSKNLGWTVPRLGDDPMLGLRRCCRIWKTEKTTKKLLSVTEPFNSSSLPIPRPKKKLCTKHSPPSPPPPRAAGARSTNLLKFDVETTSS
jgi:hypothetical protein